MRRARSEYASGYFDSRVTDPPSSASPGRLASVVVLAEAQTRLRSRNAHLWPGLFPSATSEQPVWRPRTLSLAAVDIAGAGSVGYARAQTCLNGISVGLAGRTPKSRTARDRSAPSGQCRRPPQRGAAGRSVTDQYNLQKPDTCSWAHPQPVSLA
eukprot:scaffold2357_cov399-Prasinococcus_capsulatus_cf.AAC.7